MAGALAGLHILELATGVAGPYCGKLFAGLYALYAGLVFLIAAGLLLAPVMHRVLHRFHWDQEHDR